MEVKYGGCAIDTEISVDMEVNLLILFHFYIKFFSFCGHSLEQQQQQIYLLHPKQTIVVIILQVVKVIN